MAFTRRSNRVLGVALVFLPLVLFLLARFFLALLFHSHVVSNNAARDGAEHGVVVHE